VLLRDLPEEISFSCSKFQFSTCNLQSRLQYLHWCDFLTETRFTLDWFLPCRLSFSTKIFVFSVYSWPQRQPDFPPTRKSHAALPFGPLEAAPRADNSYSGFLRGPVCWSKTLDFFDCSVGFSVCSQDTPQDLCPWNRSIPPQLGLEPPVRLWTYPPMRKIFFVFRTAPADGHRSVLAQETTPRFSSSAHSGTVQPWLSIQSVLPLELLVLTSVIVAWCWALPVSIQGFSPWSPRRDPVFLRVL
jgi:hypothetical protein